MSSKALLGVGMSVILNTGDVKPNYHVKHPAFDPEKTITQQPPRSFTFKQYPVRSPGITSGFVKSKEIAYEHIQAPIFFIGHDERSIEWVKQFGPQLNALHATGFVVHADSPGFVNTLSKLMPNVKFIAGPGTDLLNAFGIKHYPVVISATGIEQ